MLKQLLKILAILFLGLMGGMLWQTILLPYLAEDLRFQDVWFVQDYMQRQVNLYPRQQITILENEALINAIEKAEKSIVGIEVGVTRETAVKGSGLVLTVDGLIVTLADVVPKGSAFSLWVNGEKYAFEIRKRDIQQNLALIKIEAGGLSASNFANMEGIKKGQRIFFIGSLFSAEQPQCLVNEGIIRYLDNNFIYTNFLSKETPISTVVFDIEANAIGLNMLGFGNQVITIPISRIQSFAFE